MSLQLPHQIKTHFKPPSSLHHHLNSSFLKSNNSRNLIKTQFISTFTISSSSHFKPNLNLNHHSKTIINLRNPSTKMINQPDQNSISIQESITRKLKELLKPITLEVINESHLHSHHSAMRAIGGGSGETHFSIRVISTEFIGLNRLSRHRMIYNSLEDEFKNRGLHALSLQTFTPDELST